MLSQVFILNVATVRHMTLGVTHAAMDKSFQSHTHLPNAAARDKLMTVTERFAVAEKSIHAGATERNVVQPRLTILRLKYVVMVNCMTEGMEKKRIAVVRSRTHQL
jgi:hypothetical protein